MKLQVIEQSPDLTHLALSGRLDLAGVAEIETSFTAHTAGRQCNAMVDMSGVEFLASLGLGTLVNAAQSLARAGAKLVLYAPTPVVSEAMTRSNLEAVIPIADDEASARAILEATA